MSCCAEGPFIAFVVITDLHLPVPAHFGSNLSSVFVDLDLLDLLLELCLQESDSVHVHVLWWGYCSIALSENTQAAALHWEWEPSGQTWLFERLASLGSDCSTSVSVFLNNYSVFYQSHQPVCLSLCWTQDLCWHLIVKGLPLPSLKLSAVHFLATASDFSFFHLI